MNSPAAKFSLDDLPGESWEVRRTKQVLRTVAKWKNKRRMTTEQLAQRCSAFMGTPDSVRVATLSGLFAGKRKSISTTELEMFSHALMVSLSDLLYPPGEQIEVRPGHFSSSADAVLHSLKAHVVFGEWSMFAGSRESDLLKIAEGFQHVRQEAINVIATARRESPETAVSGFSLYRLTSEAREQLDRLDTYQSRWEEPIEVPVDLRWLIRPTPTRPSGTESQGGIEGIVDVSIQEVLAAEHHFEGWEVGDYRLGGGTRRKVGGADDVDPEAS